MADPLHRAIFLAGGFHKFVISYRDAHGLREFQAHVVFRSFARHVPHRRERGYVQFRKAHRNIRPQRDGLHQLDGAAVFAQVHAATPAIVLASAVIGPAQKKGAAGGGPRASTSLRFQDVAAVCHSPEVIGGMLLPQ